MPTTTTTIWQRRPSHQRLFKHKCDTSWQQQCCTAAHSCILLCSAGLCWKCSFLEGSRGMQQLPTLGQWVSRMPCPRSFPLPLMFGGALRTCETTSKNATLRQTKASHPRVLQPPIAHQQSQHNAPIITVMMAPSNNRCPERRAAKPLTAGDAYLVEITLPLHRLA